MYDLILKNGLVADGGRAKPYRADVCIQNGCVAKITRQLDETANTVLDVAGLLIYTATQMPVLWWIILWRASCIKVLPLRSQEIAVFPFYPIHRRAGGRTRSIFSASWSCPQAVCR